MGAAFDDAAVVEDADQVGLALAFMFSYQYFFLWIALGMIGMLLHFPKRADLAAASYKN